MSWGFFILWISNIIIVFGITFSSGYLSLKTYNEKQRMTDDTLQFITICLETGNSLDNCLGAVKELEE